MNQYPLWRYFLIVVLIAFGVIYAAPNLYGTDPAIQIQPKSGLAVSSDVLAKIKSTLSAQSITPIAVVQQPTGLLIRFHDAEDQLKAQGYIQALVGEQDTVALNLAPRTPEWLRGLGAEPMKLGLDLRGGIHFLYRVDTDEMLSDRLNSDIRAMGDALRNANIRYAHIALVSPDAQNQQGGIVLAFRDAQDRDQASSFLQKQSLYSDYQFSTAQKNDRYFVNAYFTKPAAIALQQQAVAQNVTTMRNRVNELGVSEPVIQQQGRNQISVDLPGIQDTARAKEIIGKVATLHFQLVDTQNDAATAASSGVVPFGDTLYQFEGNPVLLKNTVVLHGTSILSAATITGDDGRPAVSIRAGGSEVSQFNTITSESIGKPMATVYIETKAVQQIVNGKVVTSERQFPKIINIATINSALGNTFQITGLESNYAAKNLALLLRSGAYTAPIVAISENTIGPSLGKDNIRAGTLACEMGLLVVAIFMLFYYRLFGLIADIALALNVVFIVAIMSILGATLTLPGIAAIVLTVGMAVDANVLIYERIREELRNGASVQAAIFAGYERAFVTIVDANVTTLIVAIILFALGTGSVQGFAVTLIIGILTSMMTAIFFTRAAVNLIYGKRRVEKLSIGMRANTTPRTQTQG
jgi:preprotein translocase subunit SecD